MVNILRRIWRTFSRRGRVPQPPTPLAPLLDRLYGSVERVDPPDPRLIIGTLQRQRDSALQALSDITNLPLLQDAAARACAEVRASIQELQHVTESIRSITLELKNKSEEEE